VQQVLTNHSKEMSLTNQVQTLDRVRVGFARIFPRLPHVLAKTRHVIGLSNTYSRSS